MATTKAPDKGTEFILKLSGIELPADVKERIAGELRATLMRELAKTDIGGGASGGASKSIAKAPSAITARGSALLIPIGWNGGWWIGPNGPALNDAVTQFNKVRFESREVAM
jgi:stage V sporulation protein SpoVS